MDSFLELLPAPPPIPLSYGLEGLIAKALSNGEEFDMAIIYECACKLHPQRLVAEHIQEISEKFVTRVRRLAEEAANMQETAQPALDQDGPRPARSFGAVLEEWSKALTPTESCLLLADYDPTKARHMFWYEEADILEVALKAKLRHLSTQHSGSFEAVLYGFGGKYESDSVPSTRDPEEVDLSTPEGLAELRALGF